MNLFRRSAFYTAIAACGLFSFAAAAETAEGIGTDRTAEATFTIAAKAGGKEGYCRAYAKRAVNAQKTNQRRNCGFRGGRWQSNFDNHYRWCLRVPRRHSESESNASKRQLQSCQRGSANTNNEGYCRAYAKQAVNAHKANERQGCGFRGARWHSNFDRHYRWCLRVARRHAENESNARKRQLQNCR